MPHADVRIVRKADGMLLPVRAVQTSPAWMGQAGGMGGSDMNADGFRDKWSQPNSFDSLEAEIEWERDFSSVLDALVRPWRDAASKAWNAYAETHRDLSALARSVLRGYDQGGVCRGQEAVRARWPPTSQT